MNVNQIHTLLHTANDLLQQRSLIQAGDNALEALNLATQQQASTEIIRANLLLARIRYTEGRFSGNQLYFEQALEMVEAFNSDAHNGQLSFFLEALWIKGKIYQHQAKYLKARQCFEEMLAQAVNHQLAEAQFWAELALSDWHMVHNEFEKAQELLFDYQDQHLTPALATELYAQLAQIQIKRHNYANALAENQRLLELSQSIGAREPETMALNNLGVVYGAKADYKEAMERFIEALEKSKKIGFRKLSAQCLINIGTIYANLYNYEEALQRYQMVLDQYDDVLSPNTHIILLNNVGNIYYTTNQPQEALSFFQQAGEQATAANYREMMAHSLAQISRSYVVLNDLENGLRYAHQAQDLLSNIKKDINVQQINLINLGEIQFRKGNHDGAIKLISQGASLAKRLADNASEINAYKLLAEVFARQEKYREAYHYFEAYNKAREQLFEVQRNRLIQDMEIRYSIKEKQKAIEQLIKENELQAQLLKQSDQIASQNERLLEANEELKQFAYVASHDLKEPLRMISSYSQLIYKKLGKDLEGDTQIYFNYVIDGVKRMEQLLDALLRYATIGRSEESRKDVNLSDIVEVCKINLQISIREADAQVIYKNLPTVKASRSMMGQLFQNLIANGIKFKTPDRCPIIKISAEEREDHWLIKVQDNGIGIPSDYKDSIFVIFQRLHPRDSYEGTGIGLAICAKIVKKHGGKIWVESTPGEGASFYFTLSKKN